MTLTTKRLWPDEPAIDRLREFAAASFDDLDARRIGCANHIDRVYRDVQIVQMQIRDLADKVQRLDGENNPRSWAAAVNVLTATQFINSALLLHIRKNTWYENGALILLRTALETTARAVYILQGNAREGTDWSEGKIRIRASKAVPVLADAAAIWWTDRERPDRVYGWLCDFTHFSRDALLLNHVASERRLTHEDGYAAFAYVSWLTVAVANRVIGEPEPTWPEFWPERVPWDNRLDQA